MQFLSVAWFFLAAALAVVALRQVRLLPRGTSMTVVISIFAAIPLIIFAYWGQYTSDGHRAFDEMDALYPFAAGALGLLLTIVAAMVGAWAARKRNLASRYPDTGL